ncbi:MAG TPA: hypothetical protein VFF94_09210 [Novosphingobium sp.]|nr:hypothetical protein [Novosphingobium sp.]
MPMRRLALLAALPLLACQPATDWRQAAALDGEQQIRADIEDPAASFSQVQVVGDASTGQICGKVLGRSVSAGFGTPARFIVYIDRTAGPWIEEQHGHSIVTGQRFEFAWQHDCIDEGWRPS